MASPNVENYLKMLEHGPGYFPKNALIGGALGTGIGAGGGAGLVALFNKLFPQTQAFGPLGGALMGGVAGLGIGSALGFRNDVTDPLNPYNIAYNKLTPKEKMEVEDILNGNQY